MAAAEDEAYLAGLPDDQRQALARVNRPGLALLREVIDGGEALAFLGAGASAPLYPLWPQLIDDLIDASSDDLSAAAAQTLRHRAAERPDGVVEQIKHALGPVGYRELLREVFRVRRDEHTGRTWTPTHELVVRCDFRGIVTTNFDPGIVNARIAVRPNANVTGFASWTDADALDRWRTGDVFDGTDELPVLFAHGHHNQPDAIVLAAGEYRRAYQRKLGEVLDRLLDGGRIVWIGFSFADRRIEAILDQTAGRSGTDAEPGAAARHVAIMPWDARTADDPDVLRALCTADLGSRLVLYPANGRDHSALGRLLEQFADARFPPPLERGDPALGRRRPGPRLIDASAAGPDERSRPEPVVRWIAGNDPLERFKGREEELTRLDRWLADRQVRLVGVTAWGGAGKTALITHWLLRHGAMRQRAQVRGVFGWSFYENPSEDEWAQALVGWAHRTFAVTGGDGSLAEQVCDVLRTLDLIVVLDGLERVQEGQGGVQFGRLSGGLLREVLVAACMLDHGGLVVLTSRFAFPDLTRFDGRVARMLDVPALTVAEGAELLAQSGGGWLEEPRRRSLVRGIDGHALAVGVLAGALAARPPTADLDALTRELERESRTHERVRRVLAFYKDRLSDRDRALVSIVALFVRPVSTRVVLTLGSSDALRRVLAGWTHRDVQAAARERLAGLLDWHPDEQLSAHPLVRDSFRPLALNQDSVQLASQLALDGLPEGPVRTRSDALRVLEMIELLLDASEWQAADQLYRTRTDDGRLWCALPAAVLGRRSALAFAALPARHDACMRHLPDRVGFYLNEVGLFTMATGDIGAAERHLAAAIERNRSSANAAALVTSLRTMAECQTWLGHVERAIAAASEALAVAQGLSDHKQKRAAYSSLGWAYHGAAQTARAEQCFVDADYVVRVHHGEYGHLASVDGCRWAEMLIRTGRIDAALRLADHIESGAPSTDDVARCQRVRGLAELSQRGGHEHLDGAASIFRDGDMLLELATTLVDLAEQHRRARQLVDAERIAGEALEIAAARDLTPTHAAALAALARIRADGHLRGADDRGSSTTGRRTTTTSHELLARARDDADAALRLATRTRQLPWQELDALESRAHIDAIEGIDGDAAERARETRRRLVPLDLDPNPLEPIEVELVRSRRGG